MDKEILKRIAKWAYLNMQVRVTCGDIVVIRREDAPWHVFQPGYDAEQHLHLQYRYMQHLEPPFNGFEDRRGMDNDAMKKFIEACESTDALLEAIARDALGIKIAPNKIDESIFKHMDAAYIKHTSSV